MIVASNAARGTSNKALIKKVIGLVVVVAVCVVVVVIVSNVLKTFGDSDDDSQEERKFEGESLFKTNLRSKCLTTNTSELFLYHQSPCHSCHGSEEARLGTSSLLKFASSFARQNAYSSVLHMIDNKPVNNSLHCQKKLTCHFFPLQSSCPDKQ